MHHYSIMESIASKRALSSLENSPTKQSRSPKKKCPATSPLKSKAGDYDFLFDDDNDIDLPKLDLKDFCRCIVKGIRRDTRTNELILQLCGDDNSSKEATLYLQGPWLHTKVTFGELVSVKAVWDESLQGFKVDKDNGFIVTNADTLISGTTVVGSLFCQRKGVLQERFRGIERNNQIMVIGSLVHEVFQTVLAKSLKTREQIEDAIKELMETRETAFRLYDSQLTRPAVVHELREFTPKILKFVDDYVKPKSVKIHSTDVFQGRIHEITDIEENLWVPQLGLKGKVDVSVKVNQNASENILPLELKTGRASFSLEHKGQLILYQMMLTAAGRDTSSGLLLYLRENVMKQIRGTRNEHRDLIMLRNELSFYLTRSMDTSNGKLEEYLKHHPRRMDPMDLPDPIYHPSACSTCAYASICCLLAKVDTNIHLTGGHPLTALTKENLQHLSDADFEYFVKWCNFLSLEEKEARKSNLLRGIWRDSPAQRQRDGRAIMNLLIKDIESLPGERYRHIFQLSDGNEMDITTFEFSVGDYVIVSTPNRISIASGFVYDIARHTITVNLERKLSSNYGGQSFIVDKHESQSEQLFNYSNLAVLIGFHENINTLRSIVIHREPAELSSKLPSAVESQTGRKLLYALNRDQCLAALTAFRTNKFLLIKGLPGTGKTQTLVAIIRLLNVMKKTIIITSHTHAAVDNLLLRLKAYKELKMIRLGTEARIHPDLIEYSEHTHCRSAVTEDDLEKLYDSFPIVAVTCLGTAHPIFTRRRFDYCIVDEATQILQPTILRPLFYASKFVLVGDPDQLPPLVRSKEARALGASESLFERLDSDEATSTLRYQYRMNKTITKLANELTYKGHLICMNDSVGTAVLKTEKPISGEKWKQIALHKHIDQAVIFIDTLNCLERSNQFANSLNASDENMSQKSHQKSNQTFKYMNYCDAAVVFDLVTVLLKSGVDPGRIGIIAPYRAQVSLLKKLCAGFDKLENALGFAKVEVNTVDQYQGRDKDVLFYSCTRTGPATCKTHENIKGVEILEDKRRLTVAITRAKHKLVIVGDSVCLAQYTPFNMLLEKIPSTCKLRLEDGKKEFRWESELALIQNVLNIV